MSEYVDADAMIKLFEKGVITRQELREMLFGRAFADRHKVQESVFRERSAGKYCAHCNKPLGIDNKAWTDDCGVCFHDDCEQDAQ